MQKKYNITIKLGDREEEFPYLFDVVGQGRLSVLKRIRQTAENTFLEPVKESRFFFTDRKITVEYERV